MAGLRGQTNTPGADPRARRNAQRLAAGIAQYVQDAPELTVDDSGTLRTVLDSEGGLETTADGLAIKLKENGGLALSADGLEATGGVESILTAAGDLLTRNASGLIRLPKGSNGQLLRSTASGLEWATVSSSASLITNYQSIVSSGSKSASLGDLLSFDVSPDPPTTVNLPTVTAGDIGKVIIIINRGGIGAGNVIIDPGSARINGSTSDRTISRGEWMVCIVVAANTWAAISG